MIVETGKDIGISHFSSLSSKKGKLRPGRRNDVLNRDGIPCKVTLLLTSSLGPQCWFLAAASLLGLYIFPFHLDVFSKMKPAWKML